MKYIYFLGAIIFLIYVMFYKKSPRYKWKEAFERLHKENGDNLIIPDIFSDEVL